MKAIAISNFPPDFNEDKFRPEFASRGVQDITFITGPDFKSYKIADDIHTVFCFFDLMSHNQHDVAKSLTKKAKKRFVLLNRKASGWPSEPFEAFNPVTTPEKSEETTMGAPKSVSNENLDSMVKRYIEVVEAGIDGAKAVNILSEYWTGRELTSFHQAKNYVARLVATNDAPQFYLDWLQNRATRVEFTPIPNIVESNPAINTIQEIVAPPFEASHDSDVVEVVHDSTELIKLYEEDNQALIQKVADLQNEIVGLKREIEKQNKEIQSKNQEKVKKVIIALRTLVESGVINADEAFDKLSKVI